MEVQLTWWYSALTPNSATSVTAYTPTATRDRALVAAITSAMASGTLKTHAH